MQHLACLAAVVLLALPASGNAQPSPKAAGERPSAARVRELLVLAGAPGQAAFLADQLVATFRKGNPGADPRFWQEVRGAITADAYLDLVVPIYQQHLTAQEVEATIAFWRTDAGKGFLEAQPRIQEESLKVGREWGAQLHREVVAKLKAAPARDLYTGYVDRTGKLAIPPRFTGSGQRSFSEGLAKVEDAGRKAGFIDKTGRYVIEPTFDLAYPFSEGLAAAYRRDTLNGYIDKAGKWAIKPIFAKAEPFSEGLAHVVVVRDGTSVLAFIDKSGRTMLEVKGDLARSFVGGRAAVQVDGKWGFVDRTGRMVVPPRYDLVADAADGMIAVQLAGKWGFVDAAGRTAIEPAFDFVLDFAEGIAPVLRDDQWRYVDKAGREAFPGRFERASSFREGLAVVRIAGKYGYIDRSGATVIPPRFDDARDFEEGLAPVKVGDKYGFIDKTGKAVIEPQFDGVDPFSDGMAMVYVWK